MPVPRLTMYHQYHVGNVPPVPGWQSTTSTTLAMYHQYQVGNVPPVPGWQCTQHQLQRYATPRNASVWYKTTSNKPHTRSATIHTTLHCSYHPTMWHTVAMNTVYCLLWGRPDMYVLWGKYHDQDSMQRSG